MGKKSWTSPLSPLIKAEGGSNYALSFSSSESSIDWKIAATLFLQEADNFGCLRFTAFDFPLKLNLKYTNFVLIKEN